MTSIELHQPVFIGDRMLVTRRALAMLTKRHVTQIRRHCEPVACRVQPSRTDDPVLLYDADESAERLADAKRRYRSVA